MTRWEVKGADRETGIERTIVLEATTSKEAEHDAHEAGLMVESVRPAAAEPLKKLSASAASRAAAVVRIPNYTGLQMAGAVMLCLAVLYYAVGAVLAVLTALAGVANREPAMLVFAFAPGFAFLAVGAIMHGCATGALALRDIARNSFKLK